MMGINNPLGNLGFLQTAQGTFAFRAPMNRDKKISHYPNQKSVGIKRISNL
ncbi:MAG: hypothetical protein ACI815_002906 [Psychroserpens sp.]|jgi:hypothetical protein